MRNFLPQGYIYQNGLIVAKDLEYAIVMFMEASALNNVDASYELALLGQNGFLGSDCNEEKIFNYYCRGML